MIKIFIVVLNWNQPELTLLCVRSIAKSKLDKKYKVEIIVVDNGSDENKRLIQYPNAQVIRSEQNLGFAAGNNLGIKYAIDNFADYVMVINNDTIVDSQMLSYLLETIQEDKTIGIVSPKIYFAKGYEFHKEKYNKTELGKVIWYAGGKIDWNNVYGKNIGVDEVDKKQYGKEKEIDFATGACFLTRANALKEVGLFDEKYFMYFEDVDLSLRLKKKRWKIFFEPQAKLWHKVAQSSGIGSDLNDYFISRNRLLFGMKYASLRTKFALFRESIKLFIFGRHWQALGIRDYYLKKFGKGSWN